MRKMGASGAPSPSVNTSRRLATYARQIPSRPGRLLPRNVDGPELVLIKSFLSKKGSELVVEPVLSILPSK